VSGNLTGGIDVQQRRRRWLAIAGVVWMLSLLTLGGMIVVSVRRSIADGLASMLRANLTVGEASTRAYFSRLIADADRLAGKVNVRDKAMTM
jgi:hypothetical protein